MKRFVKWLFGTSMTADEIVHVTLVQIKGM